MFFKKRIISKFKTKISKIIKKNKFKCYQERNNFICTLNHDIKTPILAHIQSLELLLKNGFGKINPAQKMILNEILNSHYFILQTISNSIFLLNCENNYFKLNLEEINIIDEVKECIFAIQNQASEKHQNIKLTAKENISLRADRKITQKIIYNILQTSISSGFEDSNIEIKITENSRAISFSAKNKSIYMTKEKMKSLFDENKNSLCDFNQLGMSLNLNITKKLIDAHNWDIIAQSKKDNSCTFGFIVCK